jgi:hypothetical protein
LTNVRHIIVGMACFALASVVNALIGAALFAADRLNPLHRKLTIAGVNARMRMNGVYRP